MIRPRDVAATITRARLLVQMGAYREALAGSDDALAIEPENPAALAIRGGALAFLGQPHEAHATLERAVGLAPDCLEAFEFLTIVRAELGRPDAREAVDRAIELSPDRIRPYYLAAQIGAFKSGGRHLDSLQAIAKSRRALSKPERIELRFALGSAYEQTGQYRGAFENFALGCALVRSGLPYDEAATLDLMRRRAAAFDEVSMQRGAGAGDPSRLPVFVLGLPRSGTSLVEQILSSHPKAAGAGEIESLQPELIRALVEEGLPDTPEGMARLSRQGLRRVGSAYLRRVRPLAGKSGRLVDKSIRTFLFAGLAHQALPNARFIHVRRHPLDTCWSSFTKLFSGTFPYTYELGELGRYYRAYDRLMDHWRAVLPPRVFLELRYEDLVADLEGQSRRMLAHCGLEWDSAVLDFHKTERPVRTASVMQVRQPIYASSIGRWRNYEPWLGPLIEALGPELAHT